MRKVIFTCLLFLISISSSFAQKTPFDQQENLLKLGLLGPNIEYETQIAPETTLRAEAGLSFSFGYGGNAIGWLFEYGFYAKASPRWYYNLENRLQDGKSVKKFSGNHLSFVSMAFMNNLTQNEPNQYIFGPAWGLQRNIGSNWYLNLEIGPGISISKEETQFVPIIGLDIGIQL